MSELQTGGFVVDIGHEMTQIVPIFGGITDIRKVSTFPVGGQTMDRIIQQQFKLSHKPTDESSINNYRVGYCLRANFKEEMNKQEIINLRENDGKAMFELPDGNFIDIQTPR